VDGASLIVGLAGAGSHTPAIGDLGLVGYVAGGPTVHFAHGHVAKGFESAALRLGLPFVGGLFGLGLAVASCSNNGCGYDGVVDVAIGIILGFIAAPIVDAAALAYDEEPRKAPAARLSTPVLRLTPTAGIPRDAAGRVTPTLGVSGTF
jgi:hypothetical protein